MSKFIPNSFQVPNAVVDEALEQIDPLADNRYVHGLRAIATHLIGLLERF